MEIKHVGITVLLPVHREDQYLPCAIESTIDALYQSSLNFELLVLVNGRQSNVLCCNLQKRYGRLKFLTIVDCGNIGLPASLNTGLRLAKYNWAARMDSDDICLPSRFKDFDVNDDCDIKFYNAKLYRGSQDTGLKYRNYTSSKISEYLLDRCELIHPTCIYRVESMINIGGYPLVERSEDYLLWLEMFFNGLKFSLSDLEVICYREHPLQNTNIDGLKKTFIINAKYKFLFSFRYKNLLLFFYSVKDYLRFIYVSLKAEFNKFH